MTAKARGKNQTVVYDDGPDRAARRGCGRRSARRALDRAPEDAAVARREAEPPERRASDRRDDRDRAPPADRLPQLPRRPARRRRASPDHVRRRVRLQCQHGGGCLHAARGRGDHRARRRDRRVDARPERARVRVRLQDPRHAGARGVAGARAAALRLARHRRDRDLQAGREPVRRRRRPPARGARRPGFGRARERAPLRAAAARGRRRQGAARLRGRRLTRPHHRRDLRAHRPRCDVAVRDRRRHRCGSAASAPPAWDAPIDDGVSEPLAEGDGIEGRLVLAATALDEDRQRLLTSFAYQASVALQKARLYWQQLEAAEIANALARREPRARHRRVARGRPRCAASR